MTLLRHRARCCIRTIASAEGPSNVSPIVIAHKLLHSTAKAPANPIPHPPAPGPPPKAPAPPPMTNDERVARKKKQAEMLERGKNLRATPATGGSALNKRFWKDVRVEETPDGYQIHLDSRPVRTPSKHALTIPLEKPHLAMAIALEWDQLVSAQQALKQHYIPLTSMTARAMDIVNSDLAGDERVRESVVRTVMGYLTTDTLLCWVPEKKDPSDPSAPSLHSQQKAVAEPIIEVLKTRVWPGAELRPALQDDTILPTPQSDKTEEIVRRWVRGLPGWELAALERGVLASKSLCIAARLLVDWSGPLRDEALEAGKGAGKDAPKAEKEESRFTIGEAAEACSLEVRWQTGMWGEVEDTHDVERADLRRQLGSVILLVSSTIA